MFFLKLKINLDEIKYLNYTDNCSLKIIVVNFCLHLLRKYSNFKNLNKNLINMDKNHDIYHDIT
ncbi:hypothetical protein PFBG_01354 [Plasmodium falciparum 7G8]|uniref:Uncharacterized protein n=2 Tax=Plasmodium falciparum TaxID=5833 RepID=W7FGP4_PLAF8|nr:hypothetical protein PFNF135_01458 [Plasmodium falciparum NF135/5.C10]EUR75230.1 hypothetical protein PFBG_01354 [Plasmodium falciparum 7G8]